MIIMMMILCMMSASVNGQSSSGTVYTIGAIVALGSPAFEAPNQRYIANIKQALADIQSGYWTLNPPLPANVTVNVTIANSKGTGAGAFLV
jgi:hypothetical protein